MFADTDIKNYWATDFYEVPSNPSVQYGNFQSEIMYPFTTPDESWISGRNSYASFKVKIIQTDATATTGLFNQ